MFLSENEAFLLASGYTFNTKDIRLKTVHHKILDKNSMKIKDIYFIADYDEALRLYSHYKKSYRARMRVWDDRFIDNTLIVQLDRERENKN